MVITFTVAAGVFTYAATRGDWAIAVPGLAACALIFVMIGRSRRETAAGTDQPHLPVGSARLTIRRENASRRDILRAYRVLVDGREVGAITRGDQLTLPVEPGLHTVELRIDSARSHVAEIRVAPGEEAHLVCRPGRGLAWLAGLFGSRGYIELEPG